MSEGWVRCDTHACSNADDGPGVTVVPGQHDGDGAHSITERELVVTSLPEGARRMVLWASGNRDERVFDRPDGLDLDRPNLKAHLGFGHGIHLCIGAQLARLEAKVALEELLKRSTHFEMTKPVLRSPC